MVRALFVVCVVWVAAGCGEVAGPPGGSPDANTQPDSAEGGAIGASCDTGGNCESGDCVDGVCCDAVCDQDCMACSAAKTGGTDGTCAAVRADQDPDNECTDDGAASCDRSGACNGDAVAPGCKLYAASTVCLVGSCAAGTETRPSTCDGAGACVAGATAGCTPYVCDGATACHATCSADTSCIAGNHCDMTNSVCTTVLRVAIVSPATSACRNAGEVFAAFTARLTARGHVPTLVTPTDVDTLAELQAFDVVIPVGVVCNNSGAGDAVAQYGAYDANISEYMAGGGGVVAAGWLVYLNYLDSAPELAAAIPTNRSGAYSQNGAMTIVAGHPITAGVVTFTGSDYNAEGAGTKGGATTLLTNPAATQAGAAWQVGAGRAVYLAPLFFEPYASYGNELLLDGSQPGAIELILRSVEWAGGNL